MYVYRCISEYFRFDVAKISIFCHISVTFDKKSAEIARNLIEIPVVLQYRVFIIYTRCGKTIEKSKKQLLNTYIIKCTRAINNPQSQTNALIHKTNQL